MQDLCPLCLKKGVKRRVKLLQINLQEGVWICEEEKCIWPFGYEGFVFCPRIVGKIWSCYWDDHKSTPKLKLCSSSALPIISPNLMTNHSKSINTANPIKINNDTDVLQNMCQESQILPSENKGEYNVNTEAISNPDRSNDSLLLIDDCTEGTKIKNEFINSIAKEFKREDDSCTQRNHQNTNSLRGIPKITSIEKTNIDISNVTENEISGHQDLDEKPLCINKCADMRVKNLASNSLPISEKLVNSESHETNPVNNKVTEPKSHFNITKMEIDGLPPITISFEVPVCTTLPKTINTNVGECSNGGTVGSDTKSNALVMKNVSVRRTVTSGRHYEKFSFSAIKKKLEPNKSVDADNRNDENISNNIKKDNSDKIFHNNKTVTSCKNECEQFTSPTNVTCDYTSGQENISQDISLMNTSVNIDTVLDDFLSNDYSVTEDINDDWINSLLT
ncbi:PREDICTED: uncharacterized protein LOC107189670 [Dufourea novaeangliae]|uniref:uncharacterized protein LOC107189670 n=1 Tax=Dufourea novaeangliae TaxID=178035 RepID=UPI0007679719|nr:PREDICTED: uncharacterized protein LOC107189670 [Dufourea novaeangliae]